MTKDKSFGTPDTKSKGFNDCSQNTMSDNGAVVVQNQPRLFRLTPTADDYNGSQDVRLHWRRGWRERPVARYDQLVKSIYEVDKEDRYHLEQR
ncbi:MAG: hypothetical protein ABFD64_07525 [Armatimonadota bacterium]